MGHGLSRWTSLIASLIGALAALGGVLITQVFERRKAHDDRIWAERTNAYVRIMEWCEAWRRYARSIAEGWPASDSPEQPLPLLDEEVYARTQAFASGQVVDGVRTLSVRTINFSQTVPQQLAAETWMRARALRSLLRKEMGVDDTAEDA